MAANPRFPCRLGCGSPFKTPIYEQKHVLEGRCDLSTLATTGAYSRKEWDYIRRNLVGVVKPCRCPWCPAVYGSSDTLFTHIVEKNCGVTRWHLMKAARGLTMPSTLVAAAICPVFPPLGPPLRLKPTRPGWAGVPIVTTMMVVGAGAGVAPPPLPAVVPVPAVVAPVVAPAPPPTTTTAAAAANDTLLVRVVLVAPPSAPTITPPTVTTTIPGPPSRKRRRPSGEDGNYQTNGGDEAAGPSLYQGPMTRAAKRACLAAPAPVVIKTEDEQTSAITAPLADAVAAAVPAPAPATTTTNKAPLAELSTNTILKTAASTTSTDKTPAATTTPPISATTAAFLATAFTSPRGTATSSSPAAAAATATTTAAALPAPLSMNELPPNWLECVRTVEEANGWVDTNEGATIRVRYDPAGRIHDLVIVAAEGVLGV